VSAVTITRDGLVRHDACAGGLDLFDRIAPSGRLEIAEWTPLHAVWLAAAEPSHCGWLTSEGVIPSANLADANLVRANLSYANLVRANLAGAYVGIGATPPAGWRTTASSYLEREVGA
jgi:hypothetical protein